VNKEALTNVTTRQLVVPLLFIPTVVKVVGFFEGIPGGPGFGNVCAILMRHSRVSTPRLIITLWCSSAALVFDTRPLPLVQRGTGIGRQSPTDKMKTGWSIWRIRAYNRVIIHGQQPSTQTMTQNHRDDSSVHALLRVSPSSFVRSL